MRSIGAHRDARPLTTDDDANRTGDVSVRAIQRMFRHQTRVLITGMFVYAGIFVAALALLRP
jgi:hypothetical protein